MQHQCILLSPFFSSTFLLFSVVLFVRIQHIFFHPCHHLCFSVRFTIKPSMNHQSFAQNVPRHLSVGWSLSSGKFLRKRLVWYSLISCVFLCVFFCNSLDTWRIVWLAIKHLFYMYLSVLKMLLTLSFCMLLLGSLMLTWVFFFLCKRQILRGGR